MAERSQTVGGRIRNRTGTASSAFLGALAAGFTLLAAQLTTTELHAEPTHGSAADKSQHPDNAAKPPGPRLEAHAVVPRVVVNCGVLGSEEASAFEARAYTELLVRDADGELRLDCDGPPIVSWTTSSGIRHELPLARLDIDDWLQALDELVRPDPAPQAQEPQVESPQRAVAQPSPARVRPTLAQQPQGSAQRRRTTAHPVRARIDVYPYLSAWSGRPAGGAGVAVRPTWEQFDLGARLEAMGPLGDTLGVNALFTRTSFGVQFRPWPYLVGGVDCGVLFPFLAAPQETQQLGSANWLPFLSSHVGVRFAILNLDAGLDLTLDALQRAVDIRVDGQKAIEIGRLSPGVRLLFELSAD